MYAITTETGTKTAATVGAARRYANKYENAAIVDDSTGLAVLTRCDGVWFATSVRFEGGKFQATGNWKAEVR